jgi:DNA-binding transcriptional regulator YdaS (Cro superfamily)
MRKSLQEFIEKEGVSPSAWAKKVGISQPVITRFLSGSRGISLRTALRIQEATGGQVRVEDFNGPEKNIFGNPGEDHRLKPCAAEREVSHG